MPSVQNGDFFHVNLICRMGDQVGINTFLYSISQVIGVISDQLCIDTVSTQLGPHLKACLSEKAEYRGAEGQLETVLNKYQRVYSIMQQGMGGVIGDPLPKQVSGIITRRGEFAGRHHHGRVYVPFPSEASNDPDLGRPNLGYAALIGTYAGDMYTAVTPSIGAASCVLTPYYRFATGNPPNTFSFPYVSSIARDYWATQRRRGDFGPKNISPI